MLRYARRFDEGLEDIYEKGRPEDLSWTNKNPILGRWRGRASEDRTNMVAAGAVFYGWKSAFLGRYILSSYTFSRNWQCRFSVFWDALSLEVPVFLIVFTRAEFGDIILESRRWQKAYISCQNVGIISVVKLKSHEAPHMSPKPWIHRPEGLQSLHLQRWGAEKTRLLCERRSSHSKSSFLSCAQLLR